MKNLVAVIIFSLISVQTPLANASGQSIGSISHIHNVRVLDNQIYLGTHEGLFTLLGANNFAKIGSENFDVMGLSVDSNKIFASGHPNTGSELANPVGLIVSIDGGNRWKNVSLQNKVDFHLLESLGREIYGADSQSGKLFYSRDTGASWAMRGMNSFSEIAINPFKSGEALALKDRKLYVTRNSFKTISPLATQARFSQIEWNEKFLFASDGNNLLMSLDQGKSWKTRYKFTEEVGTLAQSLKLVVAITGSKVWKSSDGGKTFSRLK